MEEEGEDYIGRICCLTKMKQLSENRGKGIDFSSGCNVDTDSRIDTAEHEWVHCSFYLINILKLIDSVCHIISLSNNF